MIPRLMLVLSIALCGGVLAAQSVGDVLINEFCYDSANNIGTSSGADLEWLELYNTTGATIDLSNWEIRDNSGVVVIPSGNSIASGAYFVVTLTGTTMNFERYTGWTPDYVNTSTWSGLGNSGDGLAIFTSASAGNVCIDYVQYAGGNTVPGAPTWSGTRPPDVSGANDFSYSRIPDGTNGDSTPGDAGSELAASSFTATPFTPGLPNGGTVVDCYVPDEYSDHYTGGTTAGNPIQTLVPRSASEPTRMIFDLPPGYDFTTTSSFGFTNELGIRARYHDTTATVAVTFGVNGSETNVSTSNLTLPASGNMGTLNDLWGLIDVLTGQLPTTTGKIVIDITCAVSGGATTVFKLEINIDAPQITSSTTLNNILEAQTSQVTLAATGGATPYTWSLANEPAWVSINPTSGQVTMSPPSSSAAQYTFDVTVSDNNTPTRTDTKTFTVDVVAPLQISTAPTLPAVAEGGSPSLTVQATGGTTAYTWSLSGAPGWLSIGAGTGTLTGVAPASSANTYTFDVIVTDIGTPQQMATLNASMDVVSTVTITSPGTITNGQESQPYSYTFTAVGGTPGYTWSQVGLPSFLGINPGTGEISGTPTNSDAGTYMFDISVTDSSTTAQMNTLNVSLTIDPLSTTGGGGGGGGSGGGCSARGGATTLALWAMLGLLGVVFAARRRLES
ncbi:MAG: lamin tail domain-containing protein [Planctomycetes bacterium]|nr:lamin tail domain-containing protein [Planctomycetota bacterium]